MKHSVCLIDDKLPLNYAGVKTFIRNPFNKIHSSEIDFLIDNVPLEDWPEQELNYLLQGLRSKEKYKLAAFSSPAFFFNYNEYEEDYRPQIIILDWDFGDNSISTDTYLKELLDFSFSMICIFTGQDNSHLIEELVKSEPFKKYENRIKVFHKGETNSIETLQKLIDESEKNNFSFSFGQKLRNSSLMATDKILIDLGKVSVNQLGHYLKILDGGTRDFIDFLTERFRSNISSSEYNGLENLSLTDDKEVDETIAKSIWKYRLYNIQPENDNRVLRGDIIEQNGVYCFVITADCDLAHFWDKNYGYLNVIPLHIIEKTNSKLKEKFLLTRKAASVDFRHTSFTAKISGLADGSFILPFIGDLNFYGFPKEVKSISIKIPKEFESYDQKKKASLRYNSLSIGTKRIATLSEPFLTPLVQHILNSIAGYGVPDYPESISKLIIDKAKEVFS